MRVRRDIGRSLHDVTATICSPLALLAATSHGPASSTSRSTLLPDDPSASPRPSSCWQQVPQDLDLGLEPRDTSRSTASTYRRRSPLRAAPHGASADGAVLEPPARRHGSRHTIARLRLFGASRVVYAPGSSTRHIRQWPPPSLLPERPIRRWSPRRPASPNPLLRVSTGILLTLISFGALSPQPSASRRRLVQHDRTVPSRTLSNEALPTGEWSHLGGAGTVRCRAQVRRRVFVVCADAAGPLPALNEGCGIVTRYCTPSARSLLWQVN